MTQSHATDYTSAANYEASVNRDEEARKRILAREATFPLRSATDRLMKILAFGAMVFGLFWLVWILVTLVQNGVARCHSRSSRLRRLPQEPRAA